PFFFLQGYGYRTYSLIERLLAQPRVLVFYLSLIFYPLPQRLSIDHSIRLSSSLYDPWTTIPAILLLVFLLIIGIHQIKKRPFIGFPICFFFLNHVIESSVIPLEIVFEHRNYLPSAFLFLPIAVFLNYLLESYRKKNRLVFAFLFFGLSSIIFLFGMGTYIRNAVWASKKTLWEDAAIKAPENARPLVNLAIELGWKENATRQDIQTALSLLYRAIPLYKPNDFHHAEIYSNIGGIFYKIGDYSKAIAAYEKALKMDPYNILTRYNLVQSLVLMQRWDEASTHMDFIIENGSKKFSYFNLKGFVLLWQNHPYEAIQYFREALKRAPNNASVLMNTGIALSRLGSFKNATWFLKRAANASPDEIYPYLGLIENAAKSNDFEIAKLYSNKLLSIQDIESIMKSLEGLEQNFKGPPLSRDWIAPAIKLAILESIDQLKNDGQEKKQD
ncbi:MAG: tetratricopeptide repeat protein, partial [Deltaproteobacteria bacterium]|nr:tetratricopeptide repeat protein [Deltaproteobacteria bacterium]